MRRIGLALLVAALGVVVAVPVVAQGPALTEVVGGLDSPRGVAIGSDGTLYVAEVGTGGTENCVAHPELGNPCFGMTGGISSVADGVATRIVDGLISGITDTGETLGTSDVALGADGTIWFSVGAPGLGAAALRDSIPGAKGPGQLYRLDADGQPQSVADLAAYEQANSGLG